MSDWVPAVGGLRLPDSRPPQAAVKRELFVRHIRKEGNTVAILRGFDHGDACVVEAEVFPYGTRATEPTRPGPYRFADVQQATAFVTEAVEALMILGCAVHSQ